MQVVMHRDAQYTIAAVERLAIGTQMMRGHVAIIPCLVWCVVEVQTHWRQVWDNVEPVHHSPIPAARK